MTLPDGNDILRAADAAQPDDKIQQLSLSIAAELAESPEIKVSIDLAIGAAGKLAQSTDAILKALGIELLEAKGHVSGGDTFDKRRMEPRNRRQSPAKGRSSSNQKEGRGWLGGPFSLGLS